MGASRLAKRLCRQLLPGGESEPSREALEHRAFLERFRLYVNLCLCREDPRFIDIAFDYGWWTVTFSYCYSRLYLEKIFIEECIDILDRKNSIYGNEMFFEEGLFGIAIRCKDKVWRAINMSEWGVEDMFEPMRDVFIDLFNYSILALLLIRGELK